ncbi:hypothetical protein LMH87_009739 [Akanthomyces muscarius]|uniref:HNH nuclease domain-containing protein n=1 Tax=Akanthomyces muscarius TaxID=2231603 RepID=A0A9W8QCL0_AKAMU|nr:hypothetical protein LMH87_009739 [Akanthomyces muscarius]KAJ4153242.1 hypothetical protein LMH87_009739 [Akanthomyces muscarius]
MNASNGSLHLVGNIFDSTRLLFGDAYTDAVKPYLCSKKGSDKFWNILTFNCHVHKLFDGGLFGLRPLQVTVSGDGEPESYRTHFSAHWMPQTAIVSNEEDIIPDEETMKAMILETPDYKHKKKQMICSHRSDGSPVLEGDRYSIKFDKFEDARFMFAMLNYRWAVGVMRCLVGAAGLSEKQYDPDNDQDDSAYAFT